MTSKKRLLFALAASFVIALAAGYASAQTGQAPAYDPPLADSDAEAAAALAKFDVLREGPDVPVDVDKVAGQVGPREDLRAAVGRVAYRDGRTSITIVAGKRNLCLLVEERSGSGSAGCGDAVAVADGKYPLVSVDKLDEGWRVTGVFPSGVSAIALETPSGARSLTLNRSVVTTIVATPSALAWTTPDGLRRRLPFTNLTLSP